MIWQLTYGKKVEIFATTTTTKIQELETTIRRLKRARVYTRVVLICRPDICRPDFGRRIFVAYLKSGHF